MSKYLPLAWKYENKWTLPPSQVIQQQKNKCLQLKIFTSFKMIDYGIVSNVIYIVDIFAIKVKTYT